jgi:hypothetical protein
MEIIILDQKATNALLCFQHHSIISMGDRKKNRNIWKADRKVQKTTQRKNAAIRHKKAAAGSAKA